ncbi:Fic family protein [Bifidobacterium actinocoloniiforme DSM 22766]|uniref:Fic family protein n=1 Tax=Bifidobacterium actinocoloniiforme DSM 22766 TaxID=1437605 RepID=A0A086Z272_9BIFI|nr:Fic family protein [Bifidobacterium actinocoloniiforme]AKV55963.1 hypothetical protein AB656_07235 [Bifidobacterium actinocoloniiforme DSM 22766]KFI40622.1 Fic family protein [Bifidobacterium actinocoloniiforme DSM 22766]
MADAYRSLAREYHADRSANILSNHKELERQRLESTSSFRTGIETSFGELFVAMSRDLVLKLEDVLTTDKRIALMWKDAYPEFRDSYIEEAISDELLNTNLMEGVRSTRKETKAAVEAIYGARKGSATPRFGEFARLYKELVNSADTDSRTDRTKMPKDLADIRRVYDAIALDGVPDADKPDGELFRKGSVEIEGPRGVEHAGVSGEVNIGAMLMQMLGLVFSREIPHIPAVIMSHFLFEYIHPFYDGNGRTGRYLLSLYLNEDLSLPVVLSLSRVMAEHRSEYYQAFREAQDKLNCGELTQFVITFLGFIQEAQDDFMKAFGRQLEERTQISPLCESIGRERGLTGPATRILESVFREAVLGTRKGVGLGDLSQELGRSKQSVRIHVGELLEKGLAVYTKRRPLMITVSHAALGRFYAQG